MSDICGPQGDEGLPATALQGTKIEKILIRCDLKRTDEGFSCDIFFFNFCFLVLFCVFWIVCAYTKHRNIKFDATVMNASNKSL